MSLTPQQLEAARLMALGKTYREISEAVGCSGGTLTNWLHNNPEFKKTVDQARKELWVGHQAVIDNYRNALLAATRAAPRCVELLLEIAENQDTRTSDKIKALEIVLAKPRELMGILDEGKRFPEVALSEEKARAEDEQRLRRKLAQAGWIEVSDGVWTNPKDGNNWSYSLSEAYKRVVEVN